MSATGTRPGRRLAAPLRHVPRPRFGRAARLDPAVAVPVVDHLSELRSRLMWSVGSLLVAVAVSWAAVDYLLEALNRPLEGRFEVVTLSVTEPFFTQLTIAAWTGFAISLPILLYHVWQFLAPALEDWQRRAALPYLLAVPVMFLCGVAFGYTFVLEPAVQFLLGLGAGSFEVQVRAREYYSFVTTTLVGMGLVFLYPLVLLCLARIGILGSEVLRRNRKLALLGIAVVAALLPTADPVSLAIEMIPMLALFELSIWLVRLQERRAAHPSRA